MPTTTPKPTRKSPKVLPRSRRRKPSRQPKPNALSARAFPVRPSQAVRPVGVVAISTWRQLVRPTGAVAPASPHSLRLLRRNTSASPWRNPSDEANGKFAVLRLTVKQQKPPKLGGFCCFTAVSWGSTSSKPLFWPSPAVWARRRWRAPGGPKRRRTSGESAR